jgi:uroporphyrinogen-III synthase
MPTTKKKSIKASSKKVASLSKNKKASRAVSAPNKAKATAKKTVLAKGNAKKVVPSTKKNTKTVAAKTKKPVTKLKKTSSSPTKKVVAKSISKSKKVTTKVPVKKTATKKVSSAKKITPKKQPTKTKPVTKAAKIVKVIKPAAKAAPVKKNIIPKTEVTTTSTEKFVKIGVKTKKQLVAVAPQPVIEVSNYPKNKVKTILISQPKPENDKSPYYDLSKKYNLIETFRQFIKIEGIPVKDFRSQRIDILEHKAVILTSRMSVDHYFRMCNEMRVTVPESMKYFCINEATAYYLQKYIQYRKRKIFFGHQTIQDLVDVIRKNKEEKFLLPASDVHKEQICEFLDAINIKYTKAVLYRTVSANLSDIKSLNEFDVVTFFTPAGINSLKQNFPNFKQGNTRIACFGATTANALKKLGYRIDIYAPNPKNPSMSGALDEYIKEANKR